MTLTHSPPRAGEEIVCRSFRRTQIGQTAARQNKRIISLWCLCEMDFAGEWGDCSVCDLWLSVSDVWACVIFQLSFNHGMSTQTSCSAPSQGIFFAFFLTFIQLYIKDVSDSWVHLPPFFWKGKYSSTCRQETAVERIFQKQKNRKNDSLSHHWRLVSSSSVCPPLAVRTQKTWVKLAWCQKIGVPFDKGGIE